MIKAFIYPKQHYIGCTYAYPIALGCSDAYLYVAPTEKAAKEKFCADKKLDIANVKFIKG